MFLADDTVELFLDTNHDGTTYHQFGANPSGTRYDGRGRSADWNANWELKTAMSDIHWTAEFRIPFASLGTSFPQPGTVWGINFCRTRQAGDPEHASWAAVRREFHEPEAFGELIFGAPSDVSHSILSTGTSMPDWWVHSEIKLLLRNGMETPLTVRAQWTVNTATRTVTTPLKPGEEREICVSAGDDMRLDTGGNRTTMAMALTVANATTGEVYDYRTATREPVPPIRVSVDRYYYSPDIRGGRVNLTWNQGKGRFIDFEIVKELGESPITSKRISLVADKHEYDLPIAVGDWGHGRYVVSAHLLAGDEERLWSEQRALIKRELTPAPTPSAAPEFSIRSDGIILVDAKPFFPFFASSPEPERRSPLAKECFNVKYSGFGEVPRPFSRPEARLFSSISGGRLVPEKEKMLELIRNEVAARKTDPLLLYRSLAYEATGKMYRGKDNPVRVNNAAEFAEISRLFKRVDPHCLTGVQIRSNFADYKDSADIIEVAHVSSSYARKLIPHLIRDLNHTRACLGPGKPFVFWIGSSIPNARHRTAEEIRCASYLALMHGAAGIIFHLGHDGINPSMTRHWSVYPGLAREFEELVPIVTAPPQSRSAGITVEPREVDYAVRESDGQLYLIAVNTSSSRVNAQITITDPAVAGKRAKLPFESREIELTDNSFVDMFTPFESHVYALQPGL